MDIIINQIIDIDRKASRVVEETKQYIERKEKETREGMESMRSDTLVKAKEESKSIFEASLKEANEEAGRIGTASKEEIDILEKRFISAKDALEDRIFHEVLNKMKDGH